MSYRSETIANEFIKLAQRQGQALTPMQLIKLTYIAHGWSLGLYGNPLISDKIEAWMYGPVIPNLYKKLKNYGSTNVNESIENVIENIEDKDQRLIGNVYNNYGSLSASQLSNLTHREGTPWQTVYSPSRRYIDIPNDLIEDHYRQLSAQQQ